jgi:hypothetical protein
MGRERTEDCTGCIRQATAGEDRAVDDQCEPFDLDAFLHQSGSGTVDWYLLLVWTTILILCGLCWVVVIRGVLALI